ncbi:hypothetical protein ACHAXT_000715 [Thalassiosira profunda]
MSVDTDRGLASAASAASEEDGFVDAVDHLPAHQNGIEGNYGILERCGRWLEAIPRDDVVALQRTPEFREFLSAFDRLGEAHRRTVMLERRHLMESEEDDMANLSVQQWSALQPPSTPTRNLNISPRNNNMQRPQHLSHPMSPGNARQRRYSFLQHLAVDDVLLRIFEFVDCSSLVRTGTTCHRFRELSNRSAEQRTHRLADGRLLRSAMKMLRAQEQIEGVGPREGEGPFVPIPMLGLRRRIRVAGAGDPEYDGIYFCTGSNGNGFLFTKPRSPERRVRVRGGDRSSFASQQIIELDEVGGMDEAPGDDVDGNDNALANVAVDLNVHPVAGNEINGENENDGGGREDAVDLLYGDEPSRSRLLRCVIAKRFSNEQILWYMSKEVEDASGRITQHFAFWARLLLTGDAPPNVCQYPSQTSILARDGDPAWQALSNQNADEMPPPVVELLDG